MSRWSTRALVVDDNEMHRALLGAILASQGLSVDFAVNGEQAVQIAKSIAFDLILMDFHMPLMDGLAATALIREYEMDKGQGRAKLFLVSSCDEAEIGQRASFAGADGYIGKPVNFGRLVDVAQCTLSVRANGETVSAIMPGRRMSGRCLGDD